jgi:hypothetical protein
MGVLVPIVEGDGEVEAVPVLLRRILAEKNCWDLQIARPKNAHGCGNLTKEGGLERFIELAFRERDCAGVLILMDADDDEMCPMLIAKEFTERIIRYGARHPVGVVLARREYEGWFLASLESIIGQEIGGRSGLSADATFEGNPEEIRGAKAWLSKRLPNGRIYKETEDQAPLSNSIDFSLALERSRSFRRLFSAIDELITSISTGEITVTPN